MERGQGVAYKSDRGGPSNASNNFNSSSSEAAYNNREENVTIGTNLNRRGFGDVCKMTPTTEIGPRKSAAGVYTIPQRRKAIVSDKPSPTKNSTSETCSEIILINFTGLKPSQRTPENCTEPWLYCSSPRDHDVDHDKVGKWMIFAKNCDVDDIWFKLEMSIASGHIYAAKVSWFDPNETTHAIMVYTVDYNDIDDVIRVLDVLEETGAKLKTSTIFYKTDLQTRMGIYRGGKQRPWIYRSNNIRQIFGKRRFN